MTGLAKLGCLFVAGVVGGFTLGIALIAFAGRLATHYWGGSG
jgi:hypothetical protein